MWHIPSLVEVMDRPVRVLVVRARPDRWSKLPRTRVSSVKSFGPRSGCPSDSVAAGLSSLPSRRKMQQGMRLASQIKCVPSARIL